VETSRVLGKGGGWLTFGAVVLLVTGVFNVIDGLMAVYRSTFFVQDAVFVFSDLNTWGWIIFSLGIVTVLAGLGVLSGSQLARWFGVLVAAVGAILQMMFAQTYPFWTGLIIAMDIAVIYGLAAYGGRENVVALRGEKLGEYRETQARTDASEEKRAA
jgi:hypothetical protein